MKNFIARDGSTLSLNNNGEEHSVELYSDEGLELLSNLWIKVAAEKKIMYEPNWLGMKIIQFPSDVLAIQELIWEVKPDLIIETGVAHGGSLVLSASILELIGKGEVLGVDIDIRSHNRVKIEAHPLFHRINLLEGSSISQDILEKVSDFAKDKKKIMVFLDSNHSTHHVLEELESYSNFVSIGSYIVAHDGAQGWVWEIPRGKPAWKDDNPLTAIDKFLKKNKNFKISEEPTRFKITSSPNGFLKRES